MLVGEGDLIEAGGGAYSLSSPEKGGLLDGGGLFEMGGLIEDLRYCKIPKISPGLIFFKGPF